MAKRYALMAWVKTPHPPQAVPLPQRGRQEYGRGNPSPTVGRGWCIQHLLYKALVGKGKGILHFVQNDRGREKCRGVKKDWLKNNQSVLCLMNFPKN